MLPWPQPAITTFVEQKAVERTGKMCCFFCLQLNNSHAKMNSKSKLLCKWAALLSNTRYLIFVCLHYLLTALYVVIFLDDLLERTRPPNATANTSQVLTGHLQQVLLPSEWKIVLLHQVADFGSCSFHDHGWQWIVCDVMCWRLATTQYKATYTFSFHFGLGLKDLNPNNIMTKHVFDFHFERLTGSKSCDKLRDIGRLIPSCITSYSVFWFSFFSI